MTLTDQALVNQVFETRRPAVVVNLAAQVGVRCSIEHLDYQLWRHAPLLHLPGLWQPEHHGFLKRPEFHRNCFADLPSYYATPGDGVVS